ncbi:hypothetical protein GGR95_003469 [Sulfitobacter undariae]|uniref:Uncharacterized protein n=1 Tax=Sulfitobacter undariae TaxID=1563671 RepID=A0A7W6EBX9_9RHOB|nr:hypothetical protein [Sulfitobacter undariae]MBB3995805.1 hypothetical protein [Sulfitobacter undariae]
MSRKNSNDQLLAKQDNQPNSRLNVMDAKFELLLETIMEYHPDIYCKLKEHLMIEIDGQKQNSDVDKMIASIDFLGQVLRLARTLPQR